MSTNYSNRILEISPDQKCTMHQDCEELASFAILGEVEFTPQCASHGYAWGCDLSSQYESIIRFVLSQFDGIGNAAVLQACACSEVPGYVVEHEEVFPDNAWSVLYSDESGKVTTVWCVWCVQCLEFDLYEE